MARKFYPEPFTVGMSKEEAIEAYKKAIDEIKRDNKIDYIIITTLGSITLLFAVMTILVSVYLLRN